VPGLWAGCPGSLWFEGILSAVQGLVSGATRYQAAIKEGVTVGGFSGSKGQAVRDVHGAVFLVYPDDIRLLQHLREVKWGEVTVKIKNGRPVMGQRVLEDRKYSDDGRESDGS